MATRSSMSCGGRFTVALFVTSLSFADPALVDSAKVGILGGSVIAGALGYALLRTSAPADVPAYTEFRRGLPEWTPERAAGQRTRAGRSRPLEIVDRPLGVGDGDPAPLDP